MEFHNSLPQFLLGHWEEGEECLLSWKGRESIRAIYLDEHWLCFRDADDDMVWLLWSQIEGPIKVVDYCHEQAEPEVASHAPEAPAAVAILGDDLLHGAENVALFMFGDPAMRRKIYTYANDPKFGVPLFRMGSVICARKSRITQWIADQEAASIKERK